MAKLDEIREYVHTHDFSAEIEGGHWETDVVDDPMITTSLRLPKSLLDWVRELAATEHVKPSAWIRNLLEQQRVHQSDLEHRVSALEAILTSVVAQSSQVTRTRSANRTTAAQVTKTFRGAVAGAMREPQEAARSRRARSRSKSK